MDEDCGKQAVDSRKRRGEHVEENCEVELKTRERIEPKKEFEEAQEVVDLAEVRVNEDEIEWSTEGGKREAIWTWSKSDKVGRRR